MAVASKPKVGRPSNAERAARAAAANDAGSNDGTGEQINGNDSIDPSAIGGPGSGADSGNVDGDNGNGDTGKRRRSDAGRARGPRKSAPLDLTDLKDLILMAHVGFAVAFRSPDLELAETEGEKLAAAVQKVARHYDIPDIASETKDWIGLIICCGAIYGPRISAAFMDKKMRETAAKAQDEGSNVVSMTADQVVR